MLPERFRPYLAEFVATALFVFGGTQAVVSSSTMGFDTLAVSFSFGLGIYVWVQAIDDVSGGHMNPAVTFALIISKNIGIVKGLIYIVAQLAGATLGAAFTHAISPVSAINAVNDVNSNFTRGQAFFGETLMTFVLVYVVFSTAVRKRDNISMVPLAIGFSVLLAHIVLIPITGCSINPARSFGPALIEGKWDNHDIFWYSPLLGAFCAVIVHYLVTGEINAGDQEKQGKGDSSGAVELDEDAV